jgi:hypothetical protein
MEHTGDIEDGGDNCGLLFNVSEKFWLAVAVVPHGPVGCGWNGTFWDGADRQQVPKLTENDADHSLVEHEHCEQLSLQQHAIATP